jgi:thioesterase domain-containing protein
MAPTGWSVGGVIAFEVIRQLVATGIAVRGLVLIDSPHPYTSTPLSDATITSAFSKRTDNDGIKLAKLQMRHATQALVAYDPAQSSAGAMPSKTVMLMSREAFSPAHVGEAMADEFLSDKRDSSLLRAKWETAVGNDITVLDIPGNHFEPFEPRFVSNSFAIISYLPCSYFFFSHF